MAGGAGGGGGPEGGAGGRRMRGLLLRYVLWDALGRPGAWHAALLRDGPRAGAWARALAGEASGGGLGAGGVVALGTPGEVPLVPLLAAAAAKSAARGAEAPPAPAAAVLAVEPVRPLRAALAEVAEANGLGPWLSARAAPPPAGAAGAAGALFLAPGLEDVSGLLGALDALREAGSPARVLPARLVLRALLLELPRQANPVRVPVGSVSGFDLREFDRFAGVGVGGAGDGAGAGLSHPARLSDLRYEALAPPALLGEVQVAGERRALPPEGAASWASGPVRPLREGVCHAVAVWVDALLPGGGGSEGGGEQGDEEGCWLDGGPAGSPARRQQLHILPSPLDVRPGDALEVVYEPEAPGGARLLLRGAGAAAGPAGPGEGSGAVGGGSALQARVERWHFAMVNDHRRNDVYEAAIRTAVARAGPGARVLDIGSGSGLLGLMAARAGAGGVTGVERVGALAECARAVAGANGLDGCVQIVHAESTEVAPEALAGGRRADLLVSEILDDGLLGEHVLPSVADARARLLAPGAPVIPSAAAVWAVAIECRPGGQPLVAPAACGPRRPPLSGLDLGPYAELFRAEPGSYVSIRLDRVPHVERTGAFRALDFDFEGPLTDPPGPPGAEAAEGGPAAAAARFRRSREVRVPVTQGGPVNAVAFWFTLHLLRPEGPDQASDLCTYPARERACGARASSRCWSQAVQFLERPVACPAGATLRLAARHSATRVQFRLLDVVPPATPRA